MNKKKNQDTPGIIKNGESKTIEFKSSFRWSHYKKKIDKSNPNNTTKAICAFLNTIGGTLLIGVNDNGTIAGVESDISSYHKTDYTKGKDFFLTDISEKIKQNIGIKITNSYSIKFEKIGNQEIVRIDVLRSNEPVLHLKRDFVVRFSNSSKKLTSKSEICEYFQKYFKLDFKSKYEFEIYYISLRGYQKLWKIIIQKRRAMYYSLFFIGLISGVISIIFSFIYLIPGLILLTISLLAFGVLGTRFTIDVTKELDKRSEKSIIYDTSLTKNLIIYLQVVTAILFIFAFGNLAFVSLIHIFNLILFLGLSLLFCITYFFLHKRIKTIYRVLDEDFK